MSNFHKLGDNIFDVEQQSDSSHKMLAENKNTIANIQNSMLDLAESIKETSANHTKLHEASREINKNVEYIQGISNQINLLSRTQSIEARPARRAGVASPGDQETVRRDQRRHRQHQEGR